MNLDEAWDYTMDLFDAIVRTENTGLPVRGVASMRERWQKNKGWMIPHFEEDGRLRLTLLQDQVATPSRYEYDVALDLLYSVGERLSREKYSQLWRHDEYLRSTDLAPEVLAFLHRLPDQFSLPCLVAGRTDQVQPVSIGDSNRQYPPGTRMSRVIGHLLDQASEDSGPFEPFVAGDSQRLALLKDLVNTLYSQLISRLRPVSSTVVLSINPIDLLFASLHTDGDWRSCHCLVGGLYATGPLAYLLDSVSAIAFAYRRTAPFDYSTEDLSLPSTGRTEIPDVPLKLWRQMVYLYPSQGVALHSREYPASMPHFAKQARRLSARVLSEHLGLPYRWKKNSGRSFRVRSAGGFNYADPPSAAIYFPQLQDRHEAVVLTGSEDVICPACGADRPGPAGESTDSLLCPDCLEWFTCDACGRSCPVSLRQDVVEPESLDTVRSYCPQCYAKRSAGSAA